MPSKPPLACFAVLAALAVTALPLLFYLPAWVPLLFALMLGGRAWLCWSRRKLPPRLLLLLAMLGQVALLWLSLHTLVGREGGVALLLLLTGVKAFETATLRDWRVLLALGFFLAAMPLLFDQGMLSAIWLLLSLFALTWAMVLLAGGEVQSSVRASLSVLLYSLPLMLLLFVAMPRLPGPLWNMPSQDARATTGLSDSMAPGSIGQMIPSREPAFTVQFHGAQPQRDQLYWRVMVFDRFDGERWLAGGEQETMLPITADSQALAYTVTATPYKAALPALEQLVSAGEGVQPAGGRQLRRSDAANVARLRYDARSLAAGMFPARLDDATRQRYLQLTPDNPRARAQGERLRGEFPDERSRLMALKRWLQAQALRYTLTPPVLASDVVDGFLFASRQGFCEHFASAFAVLARAAGMPARVVVGFQGGEFNPEGGFWLVRSSDAHAWTEVWLTESQQWVRVDPTALIAPARVDAGAAQVLPQAAAALPVLGSRPPAWWVAAQMQWQRAGFVWQQWVVDYDATRQQGLFQRLGLAQVSAGSVLLLLLGGAFCVLLPLGWWLLRRRPAACSYRERGMDLLLSRLQAQGIAVQRSDTPRQMLRKADGLAAVDRAALKLLLGHWQQWRYVEALPDGSPLWRHWWLQVKRFKPALVRAAS